MSKIINLNLIRRGNTTKWEWITRRLVILAKYGWDMSYFFNHIDDPDFMTDDWLEAYYAEPFPDFLQEELDKVVVK